MCVRCGDTRHLHYHHVASFAEEHLRADPENLVLLCKPCHDWTHSKANANRELIELGL